MPRTSGNPAGSPVKSSSSPPPSQPDNTEDKNTPHTTATHAICARVIIVSFLLRTLCHHDPPSPGQRQNALTSYFSSSPLHCMSWVRIATVRQRFFSRATAPPSLMERQLVTRPQ